MARAHLRSLLPLLLVLPSLAGAQGMPPCTLQERPDMSVVELGACLDSLYVAADAELNAAYQAALGRLGDPGQRAALLRAERAWIAFRDADEALRLTLAGGNHPSIEILPDKITMTRARTAFLRGMVEGEAAPVARSSPSAAVRPPDEAVLVAAMKSDLRNLVTAEEAFFADSVRYTGRIGPGGLNYVVTGGNTLPRFTLTADGWRAVIGNPRTPTTCAIFVGATPQPPAVKEGAPACR